MHQNNMIVFLVSIIEHSNINKETIFIVKRFSVLINHSQLYVNPSQIKIYETTYISSHAQSFSNTESRRLSTNDKHTD